jgi:hypothetical protein
MQHCNNQSFKYWITCGCNNQLGLNLAIAADKAVGVADMADELDELVLAKDHDELVDERVVAEGRGKLNELIVAKGRDELNKLVVAKGNQFACCVCSLRT